MPSAPTDTLDRPVKDLRISVTDPWLPYWWLPEGRR